MKLCLRGLVLGFLMLSVSLLSLSTPSSAEIGIGISVRIGPPALPVYAQPLCPGPGYFWTPGYWAWNEVGGYYWVPGTWVVAPIGMLWTPGYWAFSGGYYGWHRGYWGPHVGFYGGINYGFGYGGVGFGGGEWRGGSFFYNRSVTNINVTNVTNVYDRTVVVNNVHASFNGPGGIEARPTPQEREFEREPHTAPLSSQIEHERTASQNRQLFASENHGRPAIAATARPGEFNGRNVERARAAGAPYHAPQPARAQSDRNPSERNPERNPERNNERNNARDTQRTADARHDNAGPGNREDRNRDVRSKSEARSRESANRERPSRDSSQSDKRQERAQQKQQKVEQKRNDKANRAQAKAEQKHSRDERR